MGKLVQVATETVTSPTATVTLTGINSDDVYMLTMNNVIASGDGKQFIFRVTKDVLGTPTPQTTANYDDAYKGLYTAGTFTNGYDTNATSWLSTSFSSGNGTGEEDDGIFYLYNFNNASEYSFITFETVKYQLTPYLAGEQGGGVYTVAESHNGISIILSDSTNIASGTFTLYKVL